jgi:hypothetical protein
MSQTEAQVNMQEYGRRPYVVGFLIIGQDQSGPYLYENFAIRTFWGLYVLLLFPFVRVRIHLIYSAGLLEDLI